MVYLNKKRKPHPKMGLHVLRTSQRGGLRGLAVHRVFPPFTGDDLGERLTAFVSGVAPRSALRPFFDEEGVSNCIPVASSRSRNERNNNNKGVELLCPVLVPREAVPRRPCLPKRLAPHRRQASLPESGFLPASQAAMFGLGSIAAGCLH